MAKAFKLTPYELSEELDFRLTDFVDPSEGGRDFDVPALVEAAEEGEFGPRVYDLSALQDWRKLNVRLRAELPLAELQRVLPPTSVLDQDSQLVISIRCASTRLRHGVRLTAVSPNRWDGDLSFQRHDVAGFLELRPMLVRRTDLPEAASGPTRLARHRGAIIARGYPALVRVDPAGTFSRGNFKITWEDFRQSPNPWRREHASDIYHLEPYAQEPVLYLNARYSQVRHVLESRARTGKDAALRDTTAPLIAQSVWVQLATAAIGGARVDEAAGIIDWPQEGWKRDTLVELLPRLYPEIAEDLRLQNAVNDFRDGAGIGSFMSRLGTVAQDMVGTWKLLESAIRASEATYDEENA